MMEIKGIMAELLEKFAQPSVYERTVSPDELRNAAMFMAKRGYLPTEQSLTALEKYLQGYALWFSGDVGTGKTSFFKALPVQRLRNHEDRRIVILNFGKLAGMTMDDLKDYLLDHRDDEIVFDDVGKEPIFNEYGSKFEVLPWLVEERMEVLARTHFTSNYPKKYFDERYGYGLFDRMYASAWFVEFKGQSRRMLAPWVRFAPPKVSTDPQHPAGSNAGGILALPAVKTAPAGHQASPDASKTHENAPISAGTGSDDKSTAPAVKTPLRAVLAPFAGSIRAESHPEGTKSPAGDVQNVKKSPFQPFEDARDTLTPPATPEAATGRKSTDPGTLDNAGCIPLP